ncbi:dual specificity protein phosphatase CDC14B-like isoform X1 [Argonauta hians]
MMASIGATVFRGPGPPALPRSRLKPKGYGPGPLLLDPTMLYRTFHILVLVCVISGARMTAAQTLQSTAATTLSNEASIEVPCLPTIALHASSTPLAVLTDRSSGSTSNSGGSSSSSSDQVSRSISNPDIFPSTMNNNNNNNNESKQPTQIVPKIPKNFSWVVDGFLAALGFPNEAANMMYLVRHGIKYLISLTAELTPSLHGFEDKLVWSQIKIKDFSPPTLQQVDEFLKVVEKARSENSAVAIHCAHGKGRTGTMIACYLIKYHNQTASEALKNIRQSRPGSVETFQQEELIYMFENQYKQSKSQK